MTKISALIKDILKKIGFSCSGNIFVINNELFWKVFHFRIVRKF